eukprot:scaffold43352_cov70-Phaeocystis_antarctica.AAC.2
MMSTRYLLLTYLLTSARQLPQHGRLLREPRILRGAQHAAAFLRGHEREGARARQREESLAGDGGREVQARQALSRDEDPVTAKLSRAESLPGRELPKPLAS